MINNVGISSSSSIAFGANQKINKKQTLCDDFYSSVYGKDVRAMNLAALNGIKKGMPLYPVSRTIEDKEILLSNKADKVKRWAYWTNPKDGKTYTVINKKDNDDGTKTVRILDSNGNLVKEKDIVPKKVIIVDDFIVRGENVIDKSCYFNLTHKDIVEMHFRRNNPLADVECANIGCKSGDEMSYDLYKSVFQDILDRINNGEKIDVVNCSFGTELNNSLKSFSSLSKEEIMEELESCERKKELDEIIPMLEQLVSKGVRLVFAAGNEGKDGVAFEMKAQGIDVVGSLSKNAKVSKFSSARQFARHYEKGEYEFEARKNGINVTGLPGVDISYEGTPYEHFEGKKAKDFLISDEDLDARNNFVDLYKKKKIGRMDYVQKVKAYRDKLFRLEDWGKIELPKEVDTSKLYYYPEDCLVLTETNGGYLVPFILKNEYSGTSFSTPVRSAKIALNNAMQEILNS